MNLFRTYIMNLHYKSFLKEKKEYLEKSEKISKFNPFDFFARLDMQLEEYLFNQTVKCFFYSSFSKSSSEKAFYCNILAKLLGDFPDLFAQTLNVFYDLEHTPSRKKLNPMNLSKSIVEQAISGVGNASGSPVSLFNVESKLDKGFISNSHYEKIKEILHSDEMEAIKVLRNYVSHYQLIFSKLSNSYNFDGTGANRKFYTFSGSELDEQDYVLFMNLAHRVIEQQVELIFYFKKMLFDKKMIKNGQRTMTMYELQCPRCKDVILVTKVIKDMYEVEKFKIDLPHSQCKYKEGHYLNLSGKKYQVHPEKYERINDDLIENLMNDKIPIYNENGMWVNKSFFIDELDN